MLSPVEENLGQFGTNDHLAKSSPVVYVYPEALSGPLNPERLHKRAKVVW